MVKNMKPWSVARRGAIACVAVVAALSLAACGKSGGDGGSGLNKSGTLTVGMNLQFKPEM